MTNKEAIIWLHGIREQFTGNCTTDTLVPISRCDIQAINLAIKVLEERPQGKWVENLDSHNDEMQASCYCSECGASCYCATDKFCHECGADMGVRNDYTET